MRKLSGLPIAWDPAKGRMCLREAFQRSPAYSYLRSPRTAPRNGFQASLERLGRRARVPALRAKIYRAANRFQSNRDRPRCRALPKRGLHQHAPRMGLSRRCAGNWASPQRRTTLLRADSSRAPGLIRAASALSCLGQLQFPSGARAPLSMNPGLRCMLVGHRPKCEPPLEAISMQHVLMMNANFFRRLIVNWLAAGRTTIKPRWLLGDPRARCFLVSSRHVFSVLSSPFTQSDESRVNQWPPCGEA